MTARVIPVLLLSGGRFVKTIRFQDPTYVGDPQNIVRVLNDKEVDEIVILDIGPRGSAIDIAVTSDIVSEAFMPVCFGGGVHSMAEFECLIAAGVEKVAVNTATVDTPDLIDRAAAEFGSQSVVASIDVRGIGDHASVWVDGGARDAGLDPVAHAAEVVARGAGEILLGSIDRDGTGEGYDLALIERVSGAVAAPVVAVGGARSVEDFGQALEAGAAAVAAGSMFVFHGRRRAVLISYLSRRDRDRLA